MFKIESLAEECALIWEGNKQKKLGELFKIEKTREEQRQEKTTIAIYGDVRKLEE